MSDEQFLEVAGLDGPARSRVAHDLLKLGQSQNNVHVAETFSQPKTVATPSRLGLTPGWLVDMSRSCWDLDVQANAERLCEFLRTEGPVLSVGSPKCKAFMDLQSTDRRDPKFYKTLEAGLSHVKSLMEIYYHWQSEQVQWFLASSSQLGQALGTLESVSRARVTKTKQFGTFITNCSPTVEELESSSTHPGTSPILFATSVLRGLRRTLEEVTGAIDSAEAAPIVEEECLGQNPCT